MTPRARFGRFLAAMRRRQGVTQAELASVLGFSCPQFCSNWERGISLPPVDYVPKILTTLRIPRREFEEKFRELVMAEARLKVREIVREVANSKVKARQ